MPRIETPIGAVRELREKRSPNGKHFLMLNGQVRAVFVKGIAHFFDETTSELEDIDTSFRVDDETGRISVLKALYRCRIRPSGVAFDYTPRGGGLVRAILVSVGGVNVDQDAALTTSIDGNKLTLHDVAQDFDVTFVANGQRIHVLHTLRSASAPKDFRWAFEYNPQGESHIDERVSGYDRTDRECQINTTASQAVDQGDGTFRRTQRAVWTGRVVVVNPETRVRSLSNSPEFPVVIDPTFGPISNDNDDGFEFNGYAWNANANYGSPNKVDKVLKDNYGRAYKGGWRFQGVTIPQGSTITSATIDFYVQRRSAALVARLYGYNTDNASVWGGSIIPQNISHTTASVPLTDPGVTGAYSLAVTTIVQEIVNRGGWSSGNSLSIFADSITSGANLSNCFFTTDYGIGASVGSAAALTVTYTAASVALPKIIQTMQAPTRASFF